MKTKLTHNLGVKILAIMLVIVSLIAGVLSVIGFVICADRQMYQNQEGYFYSDFCQNAAFREVYTVEAIYTDEGLDGVKQYLENYSDYGNAYIRLIDTETGEVLAKSAMPKALKNKNFATSDYYRGEDGYANTEIYDYTWEYEQTKTGTEYYWYAKDAVPVFSIAIAVADPLFSGDSFYQYAQYYEFLNNWKYAFLIVGVAALLLFILCLIYLFCAVGHKGESDDIFLNPVDKIPLDLLAAVYVFVWTLGICIGDAFGEWMIVLVGIVAGCVLGLSLLLTLVTRVKKGAPWRNTVIWRCLRKLKHWGGKVFCVLQKMFRSIPMIWKAVLIVCAIAILEAILLFGVAGYCCYYGFGMVLFVLFNLVLLLAAIFGIWQLRMLQKGGEVLAAGNFDRKIDTSHMYWDFRKHGENLNSIGKGMMLAVDQRMKSERLKTELITNVSHDIKTPLTSIINYVDLLQRPEITEEERAEYLETLARQAQRLKKLTEDLVEASKASTGNMSVNRVPTNVKELLSQAVAEYEEKFRAGNLEVVVRQSDDELTVMADGRLLWRMLDNLLSNVSKYALPGTRVYLTAEKVGQVAVLSVKNVSRDPLNISEEELMERFVRGDAARSSEGSGLGLNIARSLAQLQNGDLRVTIDGDLFKAEIALELA